MNYSSNIYYPPYNSYKKAYYIERTSDINNFIHSELDTILICLPENKIFIKTINGYVCFLLSPIVQEEPEPQLQSDIDKRVEELEKTIEKIKEILVGDYGELL